MINNSRNGFWNSIPPVTKNLIIINILIWIVMAISSSFSNVIVDRLGLHYWGAHDFNPVQLITYMFIHDPRTLLHVLFNMFTLYMFGRMLESVWGPKRFLIFYFACGIGAALMQEAVWALTWQHDYFSEIGRLNGLTVESARNEITTAIAAGNATWKANMELYENMLTTIGASGAVFGILLGFAFVFPNLPLYIMFIPVPIKAKYMVIGYAVLEFFLGISSMQGTVAHFAHLGGMIFGLAILLYWKKKGILGGRIY